MEKQKIKEMVAVLDTLQTRNEFEKQYIEDIKALVETVEIYYDDLDRLAKALQDNISENKEFENDYQYVNALCGVLDAADGCFNVFE